MSSVGAAPRAAVPAISARAEASRRNGARSRGPKTPEGKARAAQNALKHGLRAEKYVVLPEEDAAEFAALEAALEGELAPVGALQSILAQRIARAAWRLERAERLEVELFEEHHIPTGTLGLALIRDGNGTRSFETLLRYRGAATAELMRALRMLKALQAEQKATPMRAAAAEPAPVLMFEPGRGRAGAGIEIAPDQGAAQIAPREQPIEPEARGNSGESEPAPPADQPDQLPARPARARPNQPEQSRAGPTHARPNGPEPVPAVLPAHLESDLDEAMRIAERGGMRLFR
ncbi:MAG: hypothetical protein ACREJ5_19025 [Geminicoccaceae bacterium]